MKKQILLILMSAPLLLLHSCSKIAPENHAIVETTTNNLILDSNTIVLSDAIKIASAFLQEISHSSSAITIKSALTITKNGKPYLHVVNTNNNAGFVILSADSIYTPILAYNTNGNFNLDKKDINGGLAKWVNAHGKSLDYVRANKSPYLDSIAFTNKNRWRELGYKYNLSTSKINSTQQGIRPHTMSVPVQTTWDLISIVTSYLPPIGPLTKVNYNQVWPYNDDCPQIPNWVSDPFDTHGRWLAGCGPVAIAQIMNYWNIPSTGRYDWSQMKDLNGGGIHFIPMLLADIGSTKLSGVGNILSFYGGLNWSGGTFAQYGAGPFSIIHNVNETFADDYYAPYVFGNFGYSSASRTTTITDQLANPINGIAYGSLLASEVLDNNRPCMITATTGQNNLGLGLLYLPYADFHTWICEGDQRWTTVFTYQLTHYDPMGGIANIQTSYSYSFIDYLYMNWGWGGKDNGFFYNSNINYTQPYQDAATPDPNNVPFLDFQTVVYNIHP